MKKNHFMETTTNGNLMFLFIAPGKEACLLAAFKRSFRFPNNAQEISSTAYFRFISCQIIYLKTVFSKKYDGLREGEWSPEIQTA